MGAAFGVAAVLTLFMGFAPIHWYTSRPKAWNADAIKGISTTVGETFEIDGKNMTGTGFYLSFVVENKLGKDYTLPTNVKFFKRSQKSQALEETTITLDHAYSVPAKERAQIQANMQYGCQNEEIETGKTTERDGRECFQDAFGDVSEFVVFDYESRIRLTLPKPIFYAGTASTPKTSASGVAPDNAKPWDEYWACSEAQRLAPKCKQSKIELDEAQASASGWTPVGPLPTLPRPPKGYLLDPTPETCKIMYQWDYYCRKNGMTK